MSLNLNLNLPTGTRNQYDNDSEYFTWTRITNREQSTCPGATRYAHKARGWTKYPARVEMRRISVRRTPAAACSPGRTEL